MNGLPMTPCAVTDRLVQMLRDSDSRGAAEYGATVDRTDLSPLDWIDHATAENLDSAKYLQALRRTLENGAAQPAAAQEAVDFYVCDSCGHHYMNDGVTCDCMGRADNPPLRHVRMAPVAAAQEVAAFRLLYKTHGGEWSTQGRPWADGKPDPKIVTDAALPGSRWKIEYAYAAPVTAAPATDEQYAGADALIAHLDGLMDDGGQGGEKWEPAQAAIAGIRAWQAGTHAAPGIDLTPRPMDTAPRDGTMVRLLVQFDDHATEDADGPAWTIGASNDDNVHEDERVGWQFAGWCWDHDHFTEGKGTPVGWLPMLDSPKGDDQPVAATGAAAERARFEAWAVSIGAQIDTDEHGNYIASALGYSKLGWDARAALSPTQDSPKGATLNEQFGSAEGLGTSEVLRVADHMAQIIDYIGKRYPDATMLDRGPILRNIRRWEKRLRAVLTDSPKGGSEAAHADGWRVIPHTSPWREGERWEVYGPNGGGSVNAGDIKDQAVRELLDALAGLQASDAEVRP